MISLREQEGHEVRLRVRREGKTRSEERVSGERDLRFRPERERVRRVEAKGWEWRVEREKRPVGKSGEGVLEVRARVKDLLEEL